MIKRLAVVVWWLCALVAAAFLFGGLYAAATGEGDGWFFAAFALVPYVIGCAASFILSGSFWRPAR